MEGTLEWKVDEYGRRFRKNGTCIEYAPTINTTFGTFYEDEATENMERMREQAETQRKAAADRIQAMNTNRYCPFKIGRNQAKIDCEKTCSFYDDGCAFAKTPATPMIDTNGKYCPIAGHCNNLCAMYAGGCKLTEILKCIKHGKEYYNG